VEYTAERDKRRRTVKTIIYAMKEEKEWDQNKMSV